MPVIHPHRRLHRNRESDGRRPGEGEEVTSTT
jgi:hypothetical protein